MNIFESGYDSRPEAGLQDGKRVEKLFLDRSIMMP